MVTNVLRRYKTMILVSIFFFYLGCGITLSFLRVECVDAANTLNTDSHRSEYSNIEYAILVLTSPSNIEKRDTIRATWGKLVENIIVENGERIYRWNHTWTAPTSPPQFIKLFFVVGTQNLPAKKLAIIEDENSRTNDLLILDSFEDSYKNLAIKVLHSVKWMKENLHSLKYVLKCDDDSFVRVDLIVKDLEAFAPDMNAAEISDYVSFKTDLPSYKGLYWGYFDGRAHVYLNGKWQEQDWFLCDNYLPYALGGGYVISKGIVHYIGQNYDILSHYHSEDVSIGVWTAALDGINRVHDIRFDTQWKSRGCNNGMLVRHKQTTKDMFDMYTSLVHSKGEKLCRTESMDRKYYRYKWNVLPSSCCR